MTTLTVTEPARKALIRMLDQMKVKHFRIKVESGGCSGLKYSFDIVETPDKDDILVNFDTGYFIVLDPASITFMQGVEIDWKEEVMGSSIVIRNPNANHQCGCGKSFGA